MEIALMESETERKFLQNSSDYPIHRVGFMTSGGLAPCLNSVLASLVARYHDVMPGVQFYCYTNGYIGLLKRKRIILTKEEIENIAVLHEHGGSALGNSRVKLSADDINRKLGLIEANETGYERAARVLEEDEIDVLHTIGGDDTNTEAAKLAKYLKGRAIIILGMPKTIDNDIVPIQQTLGAVSAAEQAAIFFENVVNESTANPRCLLIHEVMGRHCGWLCARAALEYRKRLRGLSFLPGLGYEVGRKEVHAVYLPEFEIDFEKEGKRLKKLMDKYDCVNVFLSEGAGAAAAARDLEEKGVELQRDAFGHIKLDTIGVGEHFKQKISEFVRPDKVLVQKSGYFSRSAKANTEDRMTIQGFADFAVECARKGISGLIGRDYEHGNMLRAIEYERIKGKKPFFGKQEKWFVNMMNEIGQDLSEETEVVKEFLKSLELRTHV